MPTIHKTPVISRNIHVQCDNNALEGILEIPEDPIGVVLFVHGSGSSRHSPRNHSVAQQLQNAGIGTLLFDLLSKREEQKDLDTGKYRFDIEFLAERVLGVRSWLSMDTETAHLPVGYFGTSTGAAAALVAAARRPNVVAIVSRGGRPDMANAHLRDVQAPTLLVVGSNDPVVLDLNKKAMDELRCEKRLSIVPHATHLFEENGTLQEVGELARQWYVEHMPPPNAG